MSTRGEYIWSETKVGVTVNHKCYYEPINEFGQASRHCDMHGVWRMSNVDDECVTKNTFQLRQLSRVRLNLF